MGITWTMRRRRTRTRNRRRRGRRVKLKAYKRQDMKLSSVCPDRKESYVHNSPLSVETGKSRTYTTPLCLSRPQRALRTQLPSVCRDRKESYVHNSPLSVQTGKSRTYTTPLCLSRPERVVRTQLPSVCSDRKGLYVHPLAPHTRPYRVFMERSKPSENKWTSYVFFYHLCHHS